jgi:hypothetical protein
MARPKKKIGDQPAFEEPAGGTATQAVVDPFPDSDPLDPPPADPIEIPSLFRKAALEGASAGEKAPKKDEVGVLHYDPTDVNSILAARLKLDQLLPQRSIAEINLEEELILQYFVAKQLVQEAMDDPQVQTNQKAQVQNSCAAILKTLAEAQTALFTAERVKAIEQAIQKVWAGEDEVKRRAFFERYKRLVREQTALKDAKTRAFFPQKSPE